MRTLSDLRQYRDAILRLATRYGAYNVRVFGSLVRGDASSESDIDFLVNLEPDRSLIDRIALMQELEQLLGQKVDVVNERALHHLIRDQVYREVVAL